MEEDKRQNSAAQTNLTQIRIDLYKFYFESIEKISDRRETANKYFLSLNTAIFGAIGLTVNSELSGRDFIFVVVGLLLLGLLVSVIFWLLLNAYQQLNTGKFKMLHKLEQDLPLQLYSDEWKILDEGKSFRTYFPFSHIERLIPVVFGLVYVVGLIFIFHSIWSDSPIWATL